MPTPPPGAATPSTGSDARAAAPTAPEPQVPTGAPRPPGQWPTGRLVSAVARRIERDWNAHLERWDLNHASLPVLYLLSGGPRSQRELAEASGVTEQTMSRILVRLERTGYIRRRPHEQDRRRHEVVLTDEGRQTLLEAGDPRVAEQMSIRGLSPEQVRTLRDILGVMLAQRPRDGDPVPEGTSAEPR
ncbi:MarR family winged helix-turn-helix transcriptional regulator [Cellulomonas sp. APG4]|uniref:MarR family winged helix-turn-helix transcriptional regulator n=1 Tax=Cellulomonas sp. APG4 TaxID=1538656 RepID=UPI00351B6737